MSTVQRPRAELYLADRATGMTYTEIAKKHGVSKQRIAQVCGKYSEGHFKPYSEKEVVYPNLRKWLNENKMTRTEFVRRMGVLASPSVLCKTSAWFAGKNFPIKQNIDKMLVLTGLTYEELFER